MHLSSPDDAIEFAREEFKRIFVEDREILSLCRECAHLFLPDGPTAALQICERIRVSLRENLPLSLVRVGDGEGNALGMTKVPLQAFQVSAFYKKFLSQNGAVIPLSEAVKLCSAIRKALCTGDIVGFRSFRADEYGLIRTRIEEGDAVSALGFLYAREFLQRGLIEGYWRAAVVTSAWIHLDILSYLDRLIYAAESIVIITGRAELQDQISLRLGSRLDAFIAIPVQGFIPQSPMQSHFFSAFPIVQRRLDRNLRGKLVLVGAGLFGKIYCHTAMQNGAVAIDMGSAFDVLAGLETRPVHKRYDIGALRWM